MSSNEECKFREEIESLDLQQYTKDSLRSGRLVNRLLDGRGVLEKEGESSAFSVALIHGFVAGLNLSQEKPDNISTSLREWGKENLFGLYTSSYCLPGEESVYNQYVKVLDDADTLYPFLLSKGIDDSVDSYLDVLSIALLSSRKKGLGTLRGFAVVGKATGLIDIDPRSWKKVLRETAAKNFNSDVAYVKGKIELREKFKSIPEINKRVLCALKVPSDIEIVSYLELFQRFEGFNLNHSREGLNTMAKQFGISPQAVADRLNAIRESIEANDIAKVLDHDEFLEVKAYNQVIRIRRSIRNETIPEFSQNISFFEQSKLLAIKLYEEALVRRMIKGSTVLGEFDNAVVIFQEWFRNIISKVSPIQNEVSIFPITNRGINWKSILLIIQREILESNNQVFLDHRIGLILKERLAAAELLSDRTKFIESLDALHGIWDFWGGMTRGFTIAEISETLDMTPTSISSVKVPLIIDYILEGIPEYEDETYIADLLGVNATDLSELKVDSINDPNLYLKIGLAILMYKKAFNGNLLRQKKDELVEIAAGSLTENFNHFLIQALLDAQMKGASVREMLRAMGIPTPMHSTFASVFTELLRILHDRPKSKTGRG